MRRFKLTMLRVAAIQLAFGSALFMTSAAGAQNATYPNRPVHFIVPYLAGGATDVAARIIAERMSTGLGQPIIIENKTGAGVIVGTSYVQKADPDGYVLLITTLAHAINITLHKKLPYDSLRDFEPIAIFGVIHFALVVPPNVPVTDLQGLIAMLKANPGKYSYGSAGLGSPMHLGPELMKMLTSTQAIHVPYRGEIAAVNDLLAGHLTFMLSATSTIRPFVEAGKVRALAIPSPKRSTLLPNVPTTTEAGLPGFQTYSWVALLAPKGTPKPVIERLSREANAVMADPAVRKRLNGLGIELQQSSSPESAAAFIASEAEKWGKVVKTIGATID